MESNDEEFIKEYLTGNEEALRALIDKYTQSIYNFTVRFTGVLSAPDVTQDVFIKVWKNLKKFDYTKASFKTWIFTITRNTITDYLRKKKMVTFSSLDTEEEIFAENIEDEVVLPNEAMIVMEDKELINNLIDNLPSNYKEVLILHYQEDMTFKEIGELINKPLNTVKSYHHRALTLLRKDILHQN